MSAAARGEHLRKAVLKELRQTFREQVLSRDRNRCRVCKEPGHALDAHHITDRHELPADGYASENGISLCPECHLKGERFHRTGGREWEPGFHPDDLYRLIGSSLELAREACTRIRERALRDSRP